VARWDKKEKGEGKKEKVAERPGGRNYPCRMECGEMEKWIPRIRMNSKACIVLKNFVFHKGFGAGGI